MVRERPLGALAAGMVAAGLGFGLGCAERLVGAEQEELLPVCMIVAETLGYWSDGGQQVILDPDGSAATGCMCMTLDERISGVYRDDLAALAHEECEALAGGYYEFDSNDCLQDYEAGKWLPTVVTAVEDKSYLNHDGLDCDGQEGCAVSSEQSRGGSNLLLVMLLLLASRRTVNPTQERA